MNCLYNNIARTITEFLTKISITICSVGTECPDMTETGLLLDQSCHRNYNETCLYTCKPGYRPTNTTQPKNVTCTTSSAWDRPLSSLCEKIKCPAMIPNGNISTIFSREYDSICYSYRCNSGFLRPTGWPGLTCNASGHWDWSEYSTRDFCLNESDLCPSAIKNGNISARCSRYEGDVCAFYCDGGCKQSSNINALTCHNKTWNFDTDLLCTNCVQCSMAIPHGSVYRANCYAGQNCSYYCTGNLDRRTNENITAVICLNTTNGWVPSNSSSHYTTENDLCPARRCATDIPNGHILSSWSEEVGSGCRYNCDVGYHGNESEIFCRPKSKWNDLYPSWSTDVITFWSVNQHRLCTNSQQCPFEEIPHGVLDPTCRRNTGDVCLYTCDYGYHATCHPQHQAAITYNSSSTWDASFSLLCEKIVCPSSIPNGYTSCLKHNYKDNCNSYFCNSGYQPASNYHSLECYYDGEWEWTIPSPLKFCLGEKELCPRSIQGGWLSYECHRHEGNTCFFYCNECRKCPLG